MTRGQERESLNLRIPPDLKRRVVAYAARHGVSINAAASILLDQALNRMEQ